MSEDKRLLGYTRGIARIALVPATVWAFLVLIFFVPKTSGGEWLEFVTLWPTFCWLSTTSLAAWVAVRPPLGIAKQHIVCGILEGTLCTYAFQCLMFALNDPSTWRDGIFQWAALFLTFFYFVPTLGIVAVAVRMTYLAIRSRIRHNPN